MINILFMFGNIENLKYIPRFIDAMLYQDSEWYTETIIIEFTDNFVRLFFDSEPVARFVQRIVTDVLL